MHFFKIYVIEILNRNVFETEDILKIYEHKDDPETVNHILDILIFNIKNYEKISMMQQQEIQREPNPMISNIQIQTEMNVLPKDNNQQQIEHQENNQRSTNIIHICLAYFNLNEIKKNTGMDPLEQIKNMRYG